jgi:23S rRNA (cytosine1962-C5)-methyltransferase
MMETILAERPAAAAAATDEPGARPVVQVQPGRHKRARAGHPWIFSNEIAMTTEAKALPPGTLATITDSGGAALGVATFNPHPLISARFLSRDPAVAVDPAFFAERLHRALAMRDRLFDRPFYRLVWSEADRVPGLVVDRYGDVCALQVNTAGMERLTPQILAAVDDVLDPRVVILRNDSVSRALENLPMDVTIAKGALDGPIAVEENGFAFLCDPAGGQKTGWFYDHRENRARVAKLAKDQRVLDVYSYLGGFGLLAAAGGAREVICLDRSEPALALAEETAKRNGLAAICRFERSEAFTGLARLASSKERFDIVVADPPAFAKSKKDLAVGLKGYRKLIRHAAAVVAPGGYLFAASCSHHVDLVSFSEVIRGALRDVRRDGRILAQTGAGPDHPLHPYLPESAYLKGVLLALD